MTFRARVRHTSALLVLGLMLMPASAMSAPVDAKVADRADDAVLSFETVTELTGVRVVWNDDGILDVHALYAQPPRSTNLELIISPSAIEQTGAGPLECDSTVEGAMAVTVARDGAALQVTTIDGELTGSATALSATELVYSFRSPTLTRAFNRDDPFVCLSGLADDDAIRGVFPGRLAMLTRQTAKEATATALRRRFSATPRLLKCATPSTPYEDDPPSTMCLFELPAGRGRYRRGYSMIELVDGRGRLKVYSTKVLPLSVKQCGFYSGPSGGWVDPGSGAGISATAQRVSCRTARRIALHYFSNGHRPLEGFRCRITGKGYEFIAVRCTRRAQVIRITAGA